MATRVHEESTREAVSIERYRPYTRCHVRLPSGAAIRGRHVVASRASAQASARVFIERVMAETLAG